MARTILPSILSSIIRKETFALLVCIVILLQVRFYWKTKEKAANWQNSLREIPTGGLIDASVETVQSSIYEKWTNPDYKIKVLFLCFKHDYDLHMDRWFHQMVETAKKHPKLEVVGVWGEGWPGWRKDLPHWVNIKNKYGRVDAIHCHELHHAPEPGVVSDVNSGFFHEIQCVDGLGNCIEPPPFKTLDVVFLAYANTGIYVTPFVGGKLFIHQPHCAPKELFYHPVNATRDIDALLVGKVSSLYPLRSMLHDLIRRGAIPGTIREHPGYYMWEFSNDPKYQNQSQESQTEDYAKQLKRSKIIFVTSSLRRFALRKYVEAAMAGALLIGDIPAERQEEFGEYVVQINKGMSSVEIKAIIEKWLEDEPARLERAARGQQISLESYSYEHFLEGLMKGWRAFLIQGMRGFHFPHPFVMTKPWCIPLGNTPPHDCGS